MKHDWRNHKHYHWTGDDYLSSGWRRARSEAITRSNGQCQLCGMTEATEGHHLLYFRPEDQPSNFVTALCTLCHELATTLRKLIGTDNRYLRAHAELRAAIERATPKVHTILKKELGITGAGSSASSKGAMTPSLTGLHSTLPITKEEQRAITLQHEQSQGGTLKGKGLRSTLP